MALVQEHDALRQGLLRESQRESVLVALLRGHHLLQQNERRHRDRGYDQKRDPVSTFDQSRSACRELVFQRLLLHEWLSEAGGGFHTENTWQTRG